MSTSVGSVSVEVVPDARRFIEKLRREMEPAAEQIGRRVREILTREIGSASPRVRVVVDDEHARFQLRETTTLAERLGAERPTVHVDADTANAERKIRELRASAGGRGISLVGAAIALSPALIPVAAASAAGLVGMASAAGAALTAFGVLKLASSGLGDALKALSAQQHHAGETAAQQAAANRKLLASMGDLTPAAKNFALFLFGLRGRLQELKSVAQAGLLPGVEAGIKAVLPLFPALRDIVGSVAKALGGLATEAGKALNSPFWRGFFDYVRTTAAPMLKQFGETIGNFAKGFIGIVLAFAPATKSLGDGLLGASQAFARWATTLKTNRGFQDFAAFVREAGPRVVETVLALARAVGNIAKALAGTGLGLLSVITGAARVIAGLNPQVIRDVALAIGSVVLGMKAWALIAPVVTAATTVLDLAMDANPIGLVALALGAVAAAGAGVAVAFKYAADHVPEFGAALRQVWSEIVTNFKPVLKEFTMQVLPAVRQAFQSIARTIAQNQDGLRSLAQFMAATAKTAIPVLVVAIKVLGAGFEGTIRVFAFAGSALRAIGDVARTSAAILHGLVGAAKAAAAGVLAAIAGVPAAIKGAFAGAASWLITAGSNIIRGLISGIKNAVPGLKGLLGAVTSLIPSWKGPPEVDRRLLYDNGRLIMAGLMDGIGSQVGPLRQQLGGLTARVPAMTLPASASPAYSRTLPGTSQQSGRTIVVNIDNAPQPTTEAQIHAAFHKLDALYGVN